MNCPNCGTPLPEAASSCPHCGQAVIRPRDVVEPELVGAEIADDARGSAQGGQGFGNGAWGGFGGGQGQAGQNPFFRHVVFTSGGPGSSAFTSCQTGLITLVLALAMGMQHGFLAFLGFAVFSALAKGLIFLASVRSVLAGRPANALLMQVLAWFCCWTIVAWLAS